MRAFSVSASSLGQLAAIYPYCFAAMALPGGSLADTLGPRWTIAAGGVVMSVGAVLFGLASDFALAFAGRLLVGLGASVMLLAGLRLAAEWFRTDEFATISGLSQAVGSLGALVATTPLALLVESVGWRNAFVTIGLVTFVLAVGAALCVRDHPDALRPGPPESPRTDPVPGLRQVFAGIPLVARNRLLWAPIATSTALYGTLMAFVGLWGVPYLRHTYGMSRIEASNLIGLMTLVLLVASPLVGWLSDRWRRRRPLLVAATAMSAVAWALLVAGPQPLPRAALVPVLILLGAGGGGVVIVFASLRELSDPRHVGVTLGLHNLPIFLNFALMQWLIGVILDARWDGATAAGARLYALDAYRAAWGFCLAVSVCALLTALRVRETQCRSVWVSADR